MDVYEVPGRTMLVLSLFTWFITERRRRRGRRRNHHQRERHHHRATGVANSEKRSKI